MLKREQCPRQTYLNVALATQLTKLKQRECVLVKVIGVSRFLAVPLIAITVNSRLL